MFSKQARILVVDDEQSVIDLLSVILEEDGYDCVTVATGEDALKRLSMDNIDVALVDLRLPGISGMDVLREIASTYPGVASIVVTGVEDVRTAVAAMKIGAVDYITKPLELERVHDSIETALQKSSVRGNKPNPRRGSDEVDWTAHLDAIARGVQLKLESITSEATKMTIIERTVANARGLNIPDDQIDKWADARQKQNADRINIMNSLLEKLERNPIAQILLGVTDVHKCPPGHDSCLN